MKTAHCIPWATPLLQQFSFISYTKAILIATLIHSYEQNNLYTVFPTALSPKVKMKSLMVGCLNYATPPLLLTELNGNAATSFYDLQYIVHKETDCVSVLSLCHQKQEVHY